MDRQVQSKKQQRWTSAASALVIAVMTGVCLTPFMLILSASFTSERAITLHGYRLFPPEFSLTAYGLIFGNFTTVSGSFLVTCGLTLTGTAAGLFFIAMTGYALQRPDFEFRNAISFYIYFTTLFSGGLIPFYLLVNRDLHLKDNYLAVLLPLMMSPFLILLMKSYFRVVPLSVTESAKIDGAGDFMIFTRLVLPLTKPGLATVGLFLAFSYWNEWYYSMLFLSSQVRFRPLQLFLYSCLNTGDYIRSSVASSGGSFGQYPAETLRMATAVVVTLPVLLLYPFFQHFFVHGITQGAVKG